MVRYTLKILQQILQDFKSMSDLFGILRIQRLKLNGVSQNLLTNGGTYFNARKGSHINREMALSKGEAFYLFTICSEFKGYHILITSYHRINA